MWVSKDEYNNAFQQLKNQNLWKYDEEIYEIMSLMGIRVHTYSEDEVVEGLKDELKKLNEEELGG